ncbi:hypothetical protein PCC6912_39750 [Chlorogloeopsis fritschii PCC 6912]|uniref:Uncharacterized protein n=1 Tax=Chlorogloeopsis fritschii PCC 6912 TaxID=211165 RepID=A0A433N696_CHLFR|nr:hypothetical protein [Chlorogloeopsis fritschii]RUR77016.1 hypothetical protein PCC6912_39750 [Chlorogloeopsis fritschii PCC 6912]
MNIVLKNTTAVFSVVLLLGCLATNQIRQSNSKSVSFGDVFNDLGDYLPNPEDINKPPQVEPTNTRSKPYAEKLCKTAAKGRKFVRVEWDYVWNVWNCVYQ